MGDGWNRGWTRGCNPVRGGAWRRLRGRAVSCQHVVSGLYRSTLLYDVNGT